MAEHPTDPAAEPQVGIFWILAVGGQLALLSDRVLLANAEPYGDFLTHGGHYDYWTQLAKLGGAELRRRQLPATPTWSEYEEWPRGRVIFHMPSQRFVLYADSKIQHPSAITLIVKSFGILDDAFDVRSDHHYVSVRNVPLGLS